MRRKSSSEIGGLGWNTGFSLYNVKPTFEYAFCVAPYERIRVLCAQLLRAENPPVIQMVADQLKEAIDSYAKSVQGDYPTLELSSLAGEKRAA
jgi:hypothetical protein